MKGLRDVVILATILIFDNHGPIFINSCLASNESGDIYQGYEFPGSKIESGTG